MKLLRVEKKITLIAGIVAVTLIIAAASYGAFTYYSHRLSAQAGNVFMQYYRDYEKLSTENKPFTQDFIDSVARSGQQYKQSAYGPFFLALQADLEEAQGNRPEALAAMTQAVSMMSSIDPVLFYTYATKLALMEFETSDPAIQTKGRKSLEKLALNKSNPVRDMAWFYMGYQALLDSDNQGVQVAWGNLFDAQKNPQSVWGMRAQSLLNYTA